MGRSLLNWHDLWAAEQMMRACVDEQLTSRWSIDQRLFSSSVDKEQRLMISDRSCMMTWQWAALMISKWAWLELSRWSAALTSSRIDWRNRWCWWHKWRIARTECFGTQTLWKLWIVDIPSRTVCAWTMMCWITDIILVWMLCTRCYTQAWWNNIDSCKWTLMGMLLTCWHNLWK